MLQLVNPQNRAICFQFLNWLALANLYLQPNPPTWSHPTTRSHRESTYFPNSTEQKSMPKPKAITKTKNLKKSRIQDHNLDHGCVKDQWPYPNQDQIAKPQSGTSSILQSPKWGLKGHGCSLHLENKDREPKFGSWLYQRPVIISESRSRCQTPVRSLQHPPKPQMTT